MTKKPMTVEQIDRAAQKRASRERDMADIKAGRATPDEVRRRNSFFGALDRTMARMVVRRARLP